MLTKVVGFNDAGRRVGQSHPRAALTDREVELMRQLYEEYPRGHPKHWSMGQLARKFEVAKSTVADIVTYRCRTEAVVYRVVRMKRRR